MNLLEFASHYDHLLKKSTVNGEQVERLKPRTHSDTVAVRIYTFNPNIYPNPSLFFEAENKRERYH